ncbi:hypothetical protein Bbelb_298190 [Branchiostoma belcheri]|nr:hypothetical protein Bbelb_298190 [Branchiostoma belcheri]
MLFLRGKTPDWRGISPTSVFARRKFRRTWGTEVFVSYSRHLQTPFEVQSVCSADKEHGREISVIPSNFVVWHKMAGKQSERGKKDGPSGSGSRSAGNPTGQKSNDIDGDWERRIVPRIFSEIKDACHTEMGSGLRKKELLRRIQMRAYGSPDSHTHDSRWEHISKPMAGRHTVLEPPPPNQRAFI